MELLGVKGLVSGCLFAEILANWGRAVVRLIEVETNPEVNADIRKNTGGLWAGPLLCAEERKWTRLDLQTLGIGSHPRFSAP